MHNFDLIKRGDPGDESRHECLEMPLGVVEFVEGAVDGSLEEEDTGATGEVVVALHAHFGVGSGASWMAEATKSLLQRDS